MDRTRHPDWLPRLRSVIETYRRRPFVRGSVDCATFVADAVQAVSGTDKLVYLRRRYTTEAGALRLLKNLGDVSANQHFDRVFQVCPAPLLQRGDLARVPHAGALTTPAIVWGNQAVAFAESGGLIAVALEHVNHGWVV